MKNISKKQRHLERIRAERDIFVGGPVMSIEWGMDESWPVLYVSQNCLSILGYTQEEM